MQSVAVQMHSSVGLKMLVERSELQAVRVDEPVSDVQKCGDSHFINFV